jgi:hypothetical protein
MQENSSFTLNPTLISGFFLFAETGIELRASLLQGRHSTTSAPPLVHFALAVVEMGSLELFALP